jgi:Arc/MetJ family transcription regulator
MVLCMRTNIDLDDELIQRALASSDARTKRAVVDEALRTFIHVKEEERRRRTYAEHFEALRPRLARIRVGEPPSQVLRHARETS